jgi:hypothetical protein
LTSLNLGKFLYMSQPCLFTWHCCLSSWQNAIF